jgi:hypothetical protein
MQIVLLVRLKDAGDAAPRVVRGLEPEMRDVCLVGRPRCARILSDGFHLIEDALIVAPRECWRRSEPELRPALDGEGGHVLELRFGHREKSRRSRPPDTRGGIGIEVVHAVPSIVCAYVEDRLTDGRTERDTERLDRPS